MALQSSGKRFGRSAIELAVETGHLEVVKYLAKQGAELDRRYSWPSCLETACQNGDTEMAELLLDTGAKMGNGKYVETHPLIETIKHGHEGVVRYLLDRGADLRRGGESHLFATASAGNESLV